MSDTKMGLDVADTLCFQLGGVRRRMTWTQFILALGLHTEQEMTEAGFGACWDGSDRLIPDKEDLRDYWIEISFDRDFLGPATSYVLIRDPVRRLCHRMITYIISSRGQALEKVTSVDLFYLRSMDRGTTNVPHLLAQYLFRHAEGRKSGARLSGGHFIGRLAMHFGLVSDEDLRGIIRLVTYMLSLINLHELGRLRDQRGSRLLRLVPIRPMRLVRQSARVLRMFQHPHRHLHPLLSPELCHRGLRGSRKRCVIYGMMLWAYEELLRALLSSRLDSSPG
ncbi:hypothetical protein Tco_1087907 [Tanacetum coccineum]